MEFFWTDKCFLGVLLISFIITLISLRKKHLRQAFAKIFVQPIAVISGIVFSFYLAIAILDSIHIPTSTYSSLMQSPSILDKILAPLDQSFEKTYSSPMSLHSYNMEIVLEQGEAKQAYVPLQYTKNIKNRAEKRTFIKHSLIKAVFLSCAFIICLKLILSVGYFFYGKKDYFKIGKLELVTLITFFICIVVLLSSYYLSRQLHILGTGKIGQDIYYYTLKSIRTGLVIGLLTTLFMLPLALFFGIAAGYYGGIIDDVIQYLYTTLSSIPGVLLITASVLSMQTYIANHPKQFPTLIQSADARLFALCMILGVTSWTSLCRLLRAEVLKLREIDFVHAAKALGSSSLTILRKHLLPNVMHIILITLVLDFSFLVLAEAVLSYVGVGVSPMTISWGNMINSARLELARDPIVWWPIMSAFSLMFILVLASNLLADALRDAFDPHHAEMG
ncbi:MAG: ABC transporter permease [Proteobacteria bacterium]|nr:ABC transporter permease [Pseudomonadota bacterium]